MNITAPYLDNNRCNTARHQLWCTERVPDGIYSHRCTLLLYMYHWCTAALDKKD